MNSNCKVYLVRMLFIHLRNDDVLGYHFSKIVQNHSCKYAFIWFDRPLGKKKLE